MKQLFLIVTLMMFSIVSHAGSGEIETCDLYSQEVRMISDDFGANLSQRPYLLLAFAQSKCSKNSGKVQEGWKLSKENTVITYVCEVCETTKPWSDK